MYIYIYIYTHTSYVMLYNLVYLARAYLPKVNCYNMAAS